MLWLNHNVHQRRFGHYALASAHRAVQQRGDTGGVVESLSPVAMGPATRATAGSSLVRNTRLSTQMQRLSRTLMPLLAAVACVSKPPSEAGSEESDSADSGSEDTADSADTADTADTAWTGTAIVDDGAGAWLDVAAVGDLAGDGAPDLLLYGNDDGYWVVPVPDTGVVGAGATSTAQLSEAHDHESAGLADFDGDGALDVALRHSVTEDCHYDYSTYMCSYRIDAEVYRGPPTGTPAATLLFEGPGRDDGAASDARAVGDIDGDGLNDLLIGVDSRFDGAFLYKVPADASGSAVVSNAHLVGEGGDTETFARGGLVALGDVNGDGADDLWLGDRGFLGPVTSLLDLDAPDFTVTRDVGLGATSAADVDGDGLADLIFRGGADTYVVPAGANGTVSTLAVGHIDASAVSGNDPSYAEPADADGDGRADLLFGGKLSAGGYAVYLTSGPVLGTVDAATAGLAWYDTAPISAEALLEGESRAVIGRYADDGSGTPLAVLHIVDVAW